MDSFSEMNIDGSMKHYKSVVPVCIFLRVFKKKRNFHSKNELKSNVIHEFRSHRNTISYAFLFLHLTPVSPDSMNPPSIFRSNSTRPTVSSTSVALWLVVCLISFCFQFFANILNGALLSPFAVASLAFVPDAPSLTDGVFPGVHHFHVVSICLVSVHLVQLVFRKMVYYSSTEGIAQHVDGGTDAIPVRVQNMIEF